MNKITFLFSIKISFLSFIVFQKMAISFIHSHPSQKIIINEQYSSCRLMNEPIENDTAIIPYNFEFPINQAEEGDGGCRIPNFDHSSFPFSANSEFILLICLESHTSCLLKSNDLKKSKDDHFDSLGVLISSYFSCYF